MKKFFILNLLLLLITLTFISTYGMWISRLRQVSYMRPQFVPTVQQRTYAQQHPRSSRTQADWEKSWGGSKQQTQWQQPEHQNFQNAAQGASTGQTWGEWLKSIWHGTTSNESQQYTQSNQTRQQAKSRTFFGYGSTSKVFKNFIALLPEGTTEENWKEKFYEFTKENHPDRVDALVMSKTISPEEGDARKTHYTNVISRYNEWKREKMKTTE